MSRYAVDVWGIWHVYSRYNRSDHPYAFGGGRTPPPHWIRTFWLDHLPEPMACLWCVQADADVE
jgi:hypothetical protein